MAVIGMHLVAGIMRLGWRFYFGTTGPAGAGGFPVTCMQFIVLPIQNYTLNRMFNHKFMIYNEKYQFRLSHV